MTPYTLGCYRAQQRLGLRKYAAGALGIALNDVANDYIDTTTGEVPSETKVVLKQLGLADYPEIVSREQLEAGLTGQPKMSSAAGGSSGLLMDQPSLEAPMYHLPPAKHHPGTQLLSDPIYQNDNTIHEDKGDNIPADNEHSVGADGGGGALTSRGGAEVPVPDQTPQRQSMSLYETSSNDTPSIWRNFDSRLQNPASNSITRFTGE